MITLKKRKNKISPLFAGAILLLSGLGTAQATPLDSGTWTQVGNMSAGGGMFNGNCNLSSSCTYSVDAAGDFWTAFPETFAGQEILFITGDRQIWGAADYGSVNTIMSSSPSFSPNITWSDAGLNGSSIGSTTTGNILYRSGAGEDPWITLRGGHCANLTGDTFPTANDCNLIIWGENNWGSASSTHASLKNASGGVQVYVSRSTTIPEPTGLALMVSGLIGLGYYRQKAA